ncbi:hypothetical protein J2S72_000887 [Peptoniphilus koenoeneniae]|uniref:Uncharacterized protein n=1 Tax=Peptoniphilus koenoeneniae TaxID=507751 RepID=A0ABU0AVM6_9FIRM|nr:MULTISPECIES: hypothetical protein [Peptoniphilus]ERT57252.1 hypothetical protein HMPREF1253_0966 [Peptoniphilus sp. BV3C26]MDQ0274866.1 hypothetical protein [Peptoniphilus koenoeneniae]
MAKQKTIPQLEAEKAENERKFSQLQHKKQQLENRITYYEKGDRHKRAQHIHIKYDGLGFIPLNELMKKETA